MSTRLKQQFAFWGACSQLIISRRSCQELPLYRILSIYPKQWTWPIDFSGRMNLSLEFHTPQSICGP